MSAEVRRQQEAEWALATYCGIEVPHGSDATFDQPADLHDECADLAGIEQSPAVESKPKGKAKSAATNDEA